MLRGHKFRNLLLGYQPNELVIISNLNFQVVGLGSRGLGFRGLQFRALGEPKDLHLGFPPYITEEIQSSTARLRSSLSQSGQKGLLAIEP